MLENSGPSPKKWIWRKLAMDWIFIILDHTNEHVHENQNRNHMISVRADIKKWMKRNSLTHKIDFNGRNQTHMDEISECLRRNGLRNKLRDKKHNRTGILWWYGCQPLPKYSG